MPKNLQKILKDLIAILKSEKSLSNKKLIIFLFVLSIFVISFTAKSQTIEDMIDLIDNMEL